MNKRDLIKACVEKWGDTQVDMLIEELAELIDAIQKLKRGRVGVKDVAEEIADVRLMLDQIEYMLKCESMVDEAANYKLLRLEQRLRRNDDPKITEESALDNTPSELRLYGGVRR